MVGTTVAAGLFLLGLSAFPTLAEAPARPGGAQEVGEAWIKAVESNDLQQILGCYSPDADLWLPGMPAAHGVEQIGKVYEVYLGAATIKQAALTNTHYVTRDEISTGWGEFALTLLPKAGGEPRILAGRFSVIARQDNGTWIYLVHHASTGPPPVEFHPKTTPPGGVPEPEEAEYLTGDITPPRKVVSYPPNYPEHARAIAREGKVVLEIIVDKKGEVEQVQVLKSDPAFDDAAVQAVRRWKYEPALKNGKPIRVYLTVIVEFNLKR